MKPKKFQAVLERNVPLIFVFNIIRFFKRNLLFNAIHSILKNNVSLKNKRGTVYCICLNNSTKAVIIVQVGQRSRPNVLFPLGSDLVICYSCLR